MECVRECEYECPEGIGMAKDERNGDDGGWPGTARGPNPVRNGPAEGGRFTELD